MAARAATEFAVCNLPHKHEAYKNMVYLNASDAARLGLENPPANGQKGPFVRINDHLIFSVKVQTIVAEGHTAIQPGTIGMGKVQRQATKASVDSRVKVDAYFPRSEQENLDLTSIELQLETYRPKAYLEVEEDHVIETVKEKFQSHMFCTGVAWVVEIEATNCVLKITDVRAVTIDDEKESKVDNRVSKSVPCGFFTEDTAIVIKANERFPQLTLHESETARANMFVPGYSVADSVDIGGLDGEVKSIFRRAFASRMLPKQLITKLQLSHVKGVLLYGPPGTGKTLIARKANQLLQTKIEPKVVNGPEILNKYVGQSEENIRNLFADAEAAQKAGREKPTDVHVIIFDELDAICKQRGTSGGSTGVGDTVVNQLLSKMDGVDQLNNVIVIGMTNRKDMIDDALLRPGRFEVHIEIGLPDVHGRLEIFQIHTRNLHASNMLASDVDLRDLSERTKNFSGAEISGIVKSATSFAIYGELDVGKDEERGKQTLRIEPDLKNIMVTMAHFERALEEVKPMFGVAEEDLAQSVRNGIIEYSEEFTNVFGACKTIVNQVKSSSKFPLQSILLEGTSGSGMTAIAAELGRRAEFPFTKLISPEDYIGWTEQARCSKIAKIFEESYRSPSAMIILDSIERLLSYVDIGPRFSNPVLQTLLVCIKRAPPLDQRTGEQRSLLLVGTTSSMSVLEQMGLAQCFNVGLKVPEVNGGDEMRTVFEQATPTPTIATEDLEKILQGFSRSIPIKTLLMVMEMAAQESGDGSITHAEFQKAAQYCGIMAW